MNAAASAAGAPAAQEQTIVSGIFGTVTNKRVIYNRSRGWLGGGSREDIPLNHVTSIRISTKRHILFGIVLFVVGLELIAAHHSSGEKIAGALIIALSFLFFWGSPTVAINTAGRDKNEAVSWPWHNAQAQEFVEAVRQQLVSRS